MSLNSEALPSVGIYDPKIQPIRRGELKYGILKGAQDVTRIAVTSTSFSNSNIQWYNLIPEDVFLDRCVWMSIPITFTGVGTATAPSVNLFNPQAEGPRWLPINNGLIQNYSIQLNNVTITEQTYEHSSASMRVNFDYNEANRLSSVSTSEPDDGPLSILYNTNRSPYAVFSSSPYYESRASFQPAKVSTNVNTPTNMSVTYLFTEPLYAPGFDFKNRDIQGFWNVSTFNVRLSLNDPVKMWLRDPVHAGVYSSFTATVGIPTLLLTQYTANLLERPLSMNNYDYNLHQSYFSNVSPVPAYSSTSDAGVKFRSQVITLDSMPDYLIVFARAADASRTINVADIFMGINNVSINLDNQTALLSTCTKQQLYQMSNRYLNLSYEQWSNDARVGSILVLGFGSDISLPADKAPGCACNSQLKVEVELVNLLNPATVNAAEIPSAYELVVVTVTNGVLSVSRNDAKITLGTLSKTEIILAKQNPGIDMKDLNEANGMISASGGLGVGTLLKIAKSVGKAAEYLEPYAHGYGYGSGALVGGALVSDLIDNEPKRVSFSDDLTPSIRGMGSYSGGAPIGGDAGGKYIPRSALRKN